MCDDSKTTSSAHTVLCRFSSPCALQRTSRRYGDEKDAIQPGAKLWLFISRPSADQQLAIPYSGPWQVTKQLSGTLRTIRPEGDWCRQPKDITVSLNRLKRCYGESWAPQKVDHDLRQLEDAEDNAEGPIEECVSHRQRCRLRAGTRPRGRGRPCAQFHGRSLPPLLSHNRRPIFSADTRIRRTWLLPIVMRHERTIVAGPETARCDSTFCSTDRLDHHD